MNHVFDINSLSTIISTLFLFSLGVVCLLSGRNERAWKLLGMFSFVLMLIPAISFLINNTFYRIDLLLATRIIYCVSIFSVILAVYYSDVIANGADRVVFARWDMSPRTYFVVSAIITVFLVIVLLLTRWLIAGMANINDNLRPDIDYGPLIYPIVIIIVLGFVKIFHTLFKAYWESSNKDYREFLMLNLLALFLIYMPATLFEIMGLEFAFPIEHIIFAALPLAVVIFYIAILRYQFARVYELTVGLEKKVEERTAELKKTQVQLAQRDKMASVGLLVASVAHEINNPIGAVRSIHNSLVHAIDKLKKILNEVPEDSRSNEAIQTSLKVIDDANRVIDEGTKRVSDFVKRLKNFVRLDEADLQVIDIHDGINNALMLIQPKSRDRIKIIRNFGELPKVQCFSRQLNQVFLNILVNAVQAVKDKGEITVTTSFVNDRVYVMIKDSGEGIPEHNLDKIYDPGFTTKDSSVGVGLGLTIAYQTVERHHGQIRVESHLGQGTTFTIELPVRFVENEFSTTVNQLEKVGA